MSKSYRNKPKRAKTSESRYTFYEFDRDFPDDTACLDWLVGHLYPNGIHCPTCEKVTRHHRVKSRTAYACQFCGHHEYPMKGTIFEDSATSLRLWFHAIYLMAQTRGGISAKQLERELGVTYKTAWRMANKIRTLLSESFDDMGGKVEADETYMGGKRRDGSTGRPGPGSSKTAVFGMVERKGRVIAKKVPDTSGRTLIPLVTQHVLPRSIVYTDEWKPYRALGRSGYFHDRIHHAEKVYVCGDVHTNTIEGFWSLVKRGIGGVYHVVSAKHLQGYLDEYSFRYNHRSDERGMFAAFISRIQRAASATS